MVVCGGGVTRIGVALRPAVRVERGWGVREEEWPQPPVRWPTKPHQQPQPVAVPPRSFVPDRDLRLGRTV